MSAERDGGPVYHRTIPDAAAGAESSNHLLHVPSASQESSSEHAVTPELRTLHPW
jgi:hypothetical protein